VRRLWLAAFALIVVCAAQAAAQTAEEGLASWYGGKFQCRRTASGEVFDTFQFTAAHKTLPFGTLVRVTNLDNGKSVTVRINDRGPFVPGRIIDLSMAAATAIGLAGRGVAPVRLEVQPAGGSATDTYRLQVGSFRVRANAEQLLARLAAAGFAAELEEAGSDLLRVVVRPVLAAELAGLQERLAVAGWSQVLVRAD
jgi:rare lipoprotein A